MKPACIEYGLTEISQLLILFGTGVSRLDGIYFAYLHWKDLYMHHHHHHWFNVHFSMPARVGRFTLNKPRHLILSCAYSALRFNPCPLALPLQSICKWTPNHCLFVRDVQTTSVDRASQYLLPHPHPVAFQLHTHWWNELVLLWFIVHHSFIGISTILKWTKWAIDIILSES